MKLFVGNLSFATVEDDLRDLFSQYGTVTDVFVATDRVSGRSRGFGFVTMGNQAEGQAAITALEGHTLDNRPLTVNEARPKEEGGRPRSFGGGGGNKRQFSDRRR
jgi:cold-inducible RNA-binding protein